jgi:hypothetical protein
MEVLVKKQYEILFYFYQCLQKKKIFRTFYRRSRAIEFGDFLITFRNLKVPKCEIFDPFFLTPINPIWVGDLRTGEKKKFRRPPADIRHFVFLRRLSLR